MVDQVHGADAWQDEESGSRLASGMIGFAALMLVLQGGFHAIGGFIALLESNVYEADKQDLVIPMSYTAWGWLHMALGVVMVLAASALFWGRTWGRVVAVVVALSSALTNFSFMAADPVWFCLMTAIDILVIYAVTMHGGRAERM